MSTNYKSYLPQDISNYDVLLRKHYDSHVEIMSFSEHIGNRRFQIFLEINRKSFNEALVKNDVDACERITSKIAHIICHSCIPKGRFLEQDFALGWCNLGDGALVRERIRRGFLGLLFKLPLEISPSAAPLPLKPQKKKIHVNLADDRFIVKAMPSTGFVPSTITIDHKGEKDLSESDLESIDESNTEEIESDEDSDESDNDSDSIDSTPTMISKSFIRYDDVLFYGENADIIFHFDHLGNNRLQNFVTLNRQNYFMGCDMTNNFLEYARELMKKFEEAYPNTRFLRQQNHNSIDMWIQMDIDTAIIKMSSSISYALKQFSSESNFDKSSDDFTNKRFKSDDPSDLTNNASSRMGMMLQPRTHRSRAA